MVLGRPFQYRVLIMTQVPRLRLWAGATLRLNVSACSHVLGHRLAEAHARIEPLATRPFMRPLKHEVGAP